MHRIALIVSLAFSILFSSLAHAALVGTTDGSFEVSPVGAATYSIPIKIAPGISGVQPKLSIEYNSQGGIGNLGVGFILSGFSQISRCPATIASNGYVGSINVDWSDKYCLDGQKLVPTNPDDIEGYTAGICKDGEAATHYSTEIESFTRIISCGTQSNGPKYFMVWTKSGLVIEYGYSVNSRLLLNFSTLAKFSPDYDETVVTWAQNKVSDTKGNYYEIGYRNDHSSYELRNPPRLHEVEFYPTIIRYTGNDQVNPELSPSRLIELKYSPSTMLPSRILKGTRFMSPGKITQINTYFNSISYIYDQNAYKGSGTLVRRYKIDYKTYQDGDENTFTGSESTGHDLLASVTECGFEAGVENCLPPTTFDWTDRRIGFSGPNVVGGDGDDDYRDFVQTGDFNGDGADDVVYFTYGKTMLMPGKGSAVHGFQTAFDVSDSNKANVLRQSRYVRTIDYDGDGVMELIAPNCQTKYTFSVDNPDRSCYFDGNTNNLIVFRLQETGPSTSAFKVINTGYSALDRVSEDFDQGTTLYTTYDYRVGDFDGDGLDDLVHGPTYKILNNNYSSYLAFTKNQHSLTDSGKFVNATHPVDAGAIVPATAAGAIHNVADIEFVRDFNGDGRTDIVVDLHPDSNDCKIYYSISKPGDAYFNFEAKSAPSILCHNSKELDNRVRLVDLNGDRLTDILYKSPTSPFAIVYINRSDGFVSYTVNFQDTDPSGKNFVDNAQAIASNFKYAKVMDYNADGRMDVLIPNSTTAGKIFNDGLSIRYNGSSHFGYLEELGSDSPRPNNWLVIALTENISAPNSPVEYNLDLYTTAANFIHGGSKKTRHILDINGDGRPDLLRSDNNRFESFINTPVSKAGVTDNAPYDMIQTITTGLGAQYHISYAPLTDHWDMSNSDPLSQTGTYQKYEPTYYKSSYLIEGERDFIAPLYVVSGVDSDIGGTDDATLYRYRGAKLNTHGRGFLGFEETEAIHYYTDSGGVKKQKQRITINYKQKFPMAGKVFRTKIYSHSNTLLMVETQNWVHKNFSVNVPSDVTYFPYTTFISKTGYREVSDGIAESRSNVITSFLDINDDGFPYDRFGNVEKVQVEKFGALESEKPGDYYLAQGEFVDRYITTTENILYENITTGSKWLLGRLKKSKVTKSGTHTTEPDLVRVSEFDYYNDGNSDDGLLKCETIQPLSMTGGLNPEHTLSTCYEYDVYGFKKLITTSGFDGKFNDQGEPIAAGELSSSSTRETTSEVFANNSSPNGDTYEIYTWNALDHLQKDTIDARNGMVKSSIGPNELPPTEYEYDEMGRVIREKQPDGTYTITEYLDCSQLGGTNYCTSDTAFVTTSQTFDSLGNSLPKSYTYFDKLLRERRVRTTGFKGEQICSDTAYIKTGLHAGRVNFKTLPYECNSNPDYDTSVQPKTQYSYFNSGEVQTVTNPDGSVETTEEIKITQLGLYVRTSSERIDSNPNMTIVDESYTDVEGNVVKVTNHHWNHIRYVRDSFGNVIRTEHAKIIEPTPEDRKIVATYDITGNRLSLDDPDMGHWEYRYNAFGELKWQKDAKGQIREITYDSLGRVVEKNEPDARSGGTTTYRWEYDDESVNKARGKLVRSCTLLHGATCEGETYNLDEFFYDNLGRPSDTIRTIEGRSYTISASYDSFSRSDVTTYPASSETDTNTLQTRNIYNEFGFLKEVTTADRSRRYWIANDANIFGNITDETLGNNLQSLRTFHPTRQTISTIKTGGVDNTNSPGQYQDLVYKFDSMGNLVERTDKKQKFGDITGVTETFHYDEFNRLEKRFHTDSSKYMQIVYDNSGNGNISKIIGSSGLKKTYIYGENGAGPHAVTTVTTQLSPRTPGQSIVDGDANADKLVDGHDVDLMADMILQRRSAPADGKPDCSADAINDSKDVHCIVGNAIDAGRELGDKRYVYDENGNMIRGAGKFIKYTASGKPYEFKSKNARLEFIYDADNSRMVQRAISKDGIRTTHYVSSLFKRVHDTKGNVKYENYIYAGGRLVSIESYRSDQSAEADRVYVLTDHQGSIDVVTSDDTGDGVSVVARYSYEPFGKRSTAKWENGEAQFIEDDIGTLSPVGDLGYTGHEMLDNVGLIHMNGRVYDPDIGRFLSPDPFVQAPGNLQSLNRYSYVNNNPLSYTDPSGYFLKRLMTELKRFNSRYGQATVRIGMTIMLMSAGIPGGEIVGPFATGFTIGAINGADRTGLIVAGLSGIAMAGVDGVYAGEKMTQEIWMKKVLIKASISGVGSAMSGGDLVEGFVTSVVQAGINSHATESNQFYGAAIAAAVGGTITEYNGGKFANGASSWAFAYMAAIPENAEIAASMVDEEKKSSQTIIDASYEYDGLKPGDKIAARSRGECTAALNACTGMAAGGSSIGGGARASPGLKGDPYNPSSVAARVRPPYKANPAHDKRSPLYNPRKTPEPSDAASVYESSIRAGMGTWYGKGGNNQVYRYFSDNAGTVHFSGIIPKAQVPWWVRQELGVKK